MGSGLPAPSCRLCASLCGCPSLLCWGPASRPCCPPEASCWGWRIPVRTVASHPAPGDWAGVLRAPAHTLLPLPRLCPSPASSLEMPFSRGHTRTPRSTRPGPQRAGPATSEHLLVPVLAQRVGGCPFLFPYGGPVSGFSCQGAKHGPGRSLVRRAGRASPGLQMACRAGGGALPAAVLGGWRLPDLLF